MRPPSCVDAVHRAIGVAVRDEGSDLDAGAFAVVPAPDDDCRSPRRNARSQPFVPPGAVRPLRRRAGTPAPAAPKTRRVSRRGGAQLAPRPGDSPCCRVDAGLHVLTLALRRGRAKSRASHTAHRALRWHDRFMTRRVLIVDDNSEFRTAARQLLERHGFVVVAEAEDWRQRHRTARETSSRPRASSMCSCRTSTDSRSPSDSRGSTCLEGDPVRRASTAPISGPSSRAARRSASFRRPSCRRRRSRHCSRRRVEREPVAPVVLLGDTLGVDVDPLNRSKARQRGSASCLPTTPCCSVRASRACSRRRDSRSSGIGHELNCDRPTPGLWHGQNHNPHPGWSIKVSPL